MSFPLIPDNLFEVALNMPIDQLDKLCTINKDFNRAICNNEYFWQRRTERYLGVTTKPSGISWKDYYRLLSVRWTFVGIMDVGPFGVIDDIVLPNNEPIVQMAAMRSTIAMVSATGQVWGMGENDMNVLQSTDDDDDEEVLYFNSPIRVRGTEGIHAVQVSCGEGFIYILDRDGKLWSRGFENIWASPGRIVRSLLAWNPDMVNDGVGRVVGPTTPVAYVECGRRYVVAIDINGDVWATGDNNYFKFGKDYIMSSRFQRLDLPFKVTKVSCGEFHIMYIDTEGNLWGMGNNKSGQLGIHPNQHTVLDIPIRVNGDIHIQDVSCRMALTVVLDVDGNVYLGGMGVYGIGFQHVFKNAQKISCGSNSATIIDIRGEVWGRGLVYNRVNNRLEQHDQFIRLGLSADDVVSGSEYIVLKGLHG